MIYYLCNRTTEIPYTDGKINGYIVLIHHRYNTYHQILYSKYVNGDAVTSTKTDIRMTIEHGQLHLQTYINSKNELVGAIGPNSLYS